MRFSVTGISGRGLSRLMMILAAGTFLAGCSSGVARFEDQIFTGSTTSPRSPRATVGAPQSQPYPGTAPSSVAQVDGGYTGSINRGAVTPATAASQPIQRSALTPAAAAPAAQPKPVMQQASVEPVRAPTPAAVDMVRTGSTSRAPDEAGQPMPTGVTTAASGDGGWSRTGGTQVTVREGETVYNLSKRFGVPASEIVRANGLASADTLAAGQKIVIPTYVYSAKAPVSAPDSNPNVAEAKSSRGSRFDVPAEKVPLPMPAPQHAVAILPQTPKPKENGNAAQATASNTSATANAATAAKAADAGNIHTVVAGDTLYGIARQRGVKATDIVAANNLSSGVLRIGQKLVIPAPGAAQVAVAAPKSVDPVVTASAKPSTAEPAVKPAAYTPPTRSEKVIEEAVATAAVAPDATGVGRMRWPVRGRVVSSYGGASGAKANDGIDIAVPEGTPVKAAENGVVIYAGDGLKEFGNTVLVRHESGLVTVYGHASALKVSRGDKVARGQEIALSGMTGAADTPKLHFEVRKDSAPVDPSKYLE